MLRSEQWSSTCLVCGLALAVPVEVCPRCGTPVLLIGKTDNPSAPALARLLNTDELLDPPSEGSLEGSFTTEQLPERPLNVMLSLAPESSELEQLLAKVDELLPPEMELQPSTQAAQGEADVSLVSDDTLGLAMNQEEPGLATAPPSLPAEQLPAQMQSLQQVPGSGDEILDTMLGRRGKRIDRLVRWFSPPIIAGLGIVLALIFVLLFLTARSTTAAGVIAPDWGLASLRIGIAAAVVGGLLLIFWPAVRRLQKWPIPLYAGLLALLLILVGAAGFLSAAPLDRLQGRWLEGQGQFGLALAAYQLSGDTLATSQDMARISIEWARQLSAQHDYGDAITQLDRVAMDYQADDALGMQARFDLIQDYLAWGDQAQRQQAFSDALAHYQALQKANYCTAVCQMQVHTHAARALLGWAQQLTTRKQYDAAIGVYQQLAQKYNDTSEGQEAEQALTAAQPVMGQLVYEDETPAAHFQVVLASQWTFDTTTQVFILLGLQYTVPTDASGLFLVPLVMVGNSYLIAWMDSSGHAGTCKTMNNQPLYIVHVLPLRAADVGMIDVDCV